MNTNKMLSYLDALAKISANVAPLAAIYVPLSKLNGYVMAEAAYTKFPLPRFDNSAVDGYGVKVSDLTGACKSTPVRLNLISEIGAGQASEAQVKSGTTIKIFTGAKVPDSVEAVIMREDCIETDGVVTFNVEATKNANIRKQGYEFASDQEIIAKQNRISPPIVGLLATLGYASFLVYQKPKVSLVITGDELIAPGNTLHDSEIYDSNSFALEAALNDLGIYDVQKFYARDTREQTRTAFENALSASDVVISSGGVSVGDRDYVKEILEELQVETIFWRLAIKPGKPVYFGKVNAKASKLVFGLPGNPVSVLVTYHQLVKPALLRMMGLHEAHNPSQILKLKSKLIKKAGRLDFVRAKVSMDSEGTLSATPSRGQDSHMMTGLAQADCLLHFAAEDEEASVDTKMTSTPINWHG